MKTVFHYKASLRCGRDQGFTLIEVMIGILVFAIGIVAVSSMAVEGFKSFTKARAETAEVNRSIKNIDTFKSTLYTNNQVFRQGGKSLISPFGTDRTDIECWDFNDTVVSATKFIAVENSQIRGPTASDNYRLYIIKADRPRVN